MAQLPWDISQYDPYDPDGSRGKTKSKQKQGHKQRGKIPIALTGTAMMARTQLFLPIARSEYGKRFSHMRETQWGTVVVSGPRTLTQSHKDLLQALLTFRGKNKSTSIEYTVGALRRILGRRISNTQRIRLLKDLRDTSIELIDKEGECIGYFGFVNSFVRLTSFPKKALFGRKVDNPKQLYRVSLSEEFLDFCKNDLALSYPSLIPNICRAKHAVTKAVIRFLLTHDNANYKEKTILKIVGADHSKDDARRSHEAFADDAEIFKELNISYNPKAKTFKYRRDKGLVFVQKPVIKA